MPEKCGQGRNSARSQASRNMISWLIVSPAPTTPAMAPQYWPGPIWLTQGSMPLTR